MKQFLEKVLEKIAKLHAPKETFSYRPKGGKCRYANIRNLKQYSKSKKKK